MMGWPPVEALTIEEELRTVEQYTAFMVPGSSLRRALERLALAVDVYRRLAWLPTDDPETQGAVTVAYGDDGRQRATMLMLAPDQPMERR